MSKRTQQPPNKAPSTPSKFQRAQSPWSTTATEINPQGAPAPPPRGSTPSSFGVREFQHLPNLSPQPWQPGSNYYSIPQPFVAFNEAGSSAPRTSPQVQHEQQRPFVIYHEPQVRARSTTPGYITPNPQMQPRNLGTPHMDSASQRPFVIYNEPTTNPYITAIETQRVYQPSPTYVIYDDMPTGPSTADIIANQSQDYVDEKLAEYQATIMQLQGRHKHILNFLLLNYKRWNLNKYN